MAAVEDVLAYLDHHYPHRGELSFARLAFMVYLADWRSAIEHGMPITDIKWRLYVNGPQPAKEDNKEPTIAEAEKKVKEAIARGNPDNVERTSREVLDFVISAVSSKSWTDLTRLVNSTFPVLTQPRNKPLNLVGLAQQYNKNYRPFFE
jgi:hypothetical protein